jgi:hypothetical protein
MRSFGRGGGDRKDKPANRACALNLLPPRPPLELEQTEGRISVLFRGRGMKRCLAEGRERFELWVGAAVLAKNLMRIAALLTKRPRKRSVA